MKIATSPVGYSITVLDVMNVVFSGVIEFIAGSNLVAIELAHLIAIDAPIVETCVKLSSILHGVNYAAEGTTLENWDSAARPY